MNELERKTRWVFRSMYFPGCEDSHHWARARANVSLAVFGRELRKELLRSWFGRTRIGRAYLCWAFGRRAA